MKLRRFFEGSPERSTLRTATVTTSAPDSASASCMSSKVAYLPVPTKSRERKLCSPIVRTSWAGSIDLTPAHEGDDLHLVPVLEAVVRVPAPGDDGPVDLHGDGGPG